VHSAATRFDRDRPVPLVSYGESCVYHRRAVSALQGAGFDWEDVFIGPSFASLRSAVTAGLGVMAITRRRAEGSGMAVWEDTPLPKLADLYSGIYVREGGARGIYEQLADDIAAAIFEPAESATELPASLAPTLKANSAA
jgi:DNA-binding transcriptional LysR family regulator